MTTQSRLSLIGWFFVAAQAILAAILGLNENNRISDIGPIISVVVTCSFATVQGVERYGVRRFVIFFLIAACVSWLDETVSILTGFPFGHYHYTDKLGFKLWLVPLAILPAYFGTAYLAWTMAQALLGIFSQPLKNYRRVTLPLIAAAIMVMWDACMDPYMATLSGNWVWHEGGPYFGVPLVNFFGWYLCVYTFYQIFALYLAKTEQASENPEIRRTAYWLQPPLIYLTGIIFYALRLVFGSHSAVKTADGKTWFSADIYAAALLVSLLTMVFVAVLTMLRVYEQRNAAERS